MNSLPRKIINVVKGWHYDRWQDRQATCTQCRKVDQCNDMALVTVDGYERFYCFDCAYEVIDDARRICPACRDYHYNAGTPFCGECRKSDEAKRIAQQVNSQLNRTKDERDNLTILEWFDTLRHYGFRCVYCRDVYSHLDHFIPVSRGGATTIDNSVPACADCNFSKHDKMPHEFILHSDALVIAAYLKRRGESFAVKHSIEQMERNQLLEAERTLYPDLWKGLI